MVFTTAASALTLLLPFLVCALFAAAVGKRIPEFSGRSVLGGWAALAAVISVEAGFYSLISLLVPAFPQGQSETGLLVQAAMYAKGLPLYPAIDSTPVYGLLYGPLSALPYAIVFKLWPSAYAASLWAFAIGSAAILVVFRLAVRSVGSTRDGILLGLGICLLAIGELSLVFSKKSEGMMLLIAGVPWLFRESRRFLPSAAIAGALCFDAKFTSLPLFLPCLVYWWATAFNLRSLVLAIALFLGLAALPFMLPGISFKGYLAWLAVASHHRMTPSLLALISIHAVPSMALWFAIWPSVRDDRPLRSTWFAIAVGYLCLVPAAIKAGSGGYQMLPLLPSLVVWFGLALHRTGWAFKVNGALAIGCATAAIMIAVKLVQGVGTFYDNARAVASDQRDLEALIDKSPKPVALVFGVSAAEQGADTNYRLEDEQLNALFDGAELLTSPMAALDLAEGGIQVPQKLVDEVALCHFKTFIGLEDQVPFVKHQLYDLTMGRRVWSDDPLFLQYGTELPKAFARSYTLTGHSGAFVTWACIQ